MKRSMHVKINIYIKNTLLFYNNNNASIILHKNNMKYTKNKNTKIIFKII